MLICTGVTITFRQKAPWQATCLIASKMNQSQAIDCELETLPIAIYHDFVLRAFNQLEKNPKTTHQMKERRKLRNQRHMILIN